MHQQTGGQVESRRGFRFPFVELVAVAVMAILLAACVAKGRGIKTWFVKLVNPSYKARPTIVASRPDNFASNVPLDAFIAVDIALPNDGKIVEPHSLPPEKADTVRLVRTGDRRPVPAHVNTTGGGDAIVLKPIEPLEPNTQYSFEVTPGVTDTAGAPFVYFSTRFTTAAASTPERFDAAFERVSLPTASGDMFTCVVIGPDNKLYASSFDGRIMRFDIHGDGTLGTPETFTTVPEKNGGPRLVTGFCFDPKSTSDNLIIWANHGQLSLERSADWSGKLSRLSGPKLSEYRDAVINLPRGVKDHLNNQPAFGPDGALYFSQASNTAMGAPDHKWGWRPERLLSAALLRLDVDKLPADKPLDAKTEDGGNYDPYAKDAPLTFHATGIRNGYDLVFHSNGRLYAPINGSAAGGNVPASNDPRAAAARRIDTGASYAGPNVPSLTGVNITEDDTLLIVDRGAYFGHPNPLRAEFVMNGGNPTAGEDPHEIPLYPVGTQPDANYRFTSYTFGKNLAPCGVIEYKSKGPLQGRLIVARYSGGDDLIVLNPNGKAGAITDSLTGINGFTGLVDPLDLVEDTRNGNIYVCEWSANCITLLRPVADGVSDRVYRQTAEPKAPAPQHVNAN